MVVVVVVVERIHTHTHTHTHTHAHHSVRRPGYEVRTVDREDYEGTYPNLCIYGIGSLVALSFRVVDPRPQPFLLCPFCGIYLFSPCFVFVVESSCLLMTRC